MKRGCCLVALAFGTYPTPTESKASIDPKPHPKLGVAQIFVIDCAVKFHRNGDMQRRTRIDRTPPDLCWKGGVGLVFGFVREMAGLQHTNRVATRWDDLIGRRKQPLLGGLIFWEMQTTNSLLAPSTIAPGKSVKRSTPKSDQIIIAHYSALFIPAATHWLAKLELNQTTCPTTTGSLARYPFFPLCLPS